MTKNINDVQGEVEQIVSDCEEIGYSGGSFEIEHNDIIYEVSVEKVDD